MAKLNIRRLEDLADLLPSRSLDLRPRRRPYLSIQEMIYDFFAGHEFIIVDQSSPLSGCAVTICDSQTLHKAYDVGEIRIYPNPGHNEPVRLKWSTAARQYEVV